MLLRDSTWRIIPISKGLASMSQRDSLSPLSRATFSFQMAEIYGLYVNGGDPNYLQVLG